MNKRSPGAISGIMQTVVTIQGAVGPATTASLFAFSLQKEVLGGQFWYATLLSVMCCPIFGKTISEGHLVASGRSLEATLEV